MNSHSRIKYSYVSLLTMLAVVLVLSACTNGNEQPPSDPYEDPYFVGFNVTVAEDATEPGQTPNTVCTNNEGPLQVGVEWEAHPGDSDPESPGDFSPSVEILVNGQFPLGLGVQYLKDSTFNGVTYTNGATFDLRERFPETIPNQIIVSVKLYGGIRGEANLYDSESATLTAVICRPPDTTP